jgi:hypothetical protein
VPVPAENVEINGAADPRCSTTPCEIDLPVGSHNIHLSAMGRLHLPNPVTASLPQEGASVNIFLGYNLAGRWRRESDGLEVDVEMWHRDRILAYPPTAACPDTELVVHGFSPLGAICLDHDDTLSLCKTHAPECGGNSAQGRILENGRRVEFCENTCFVTYVYTKVD